jgi:adenosylhomocysteine nucleosidase
MEYRGILSRMDDQRMVALQVDWVRSGRLGDHAVLLVANGAGSYRAAIATDRGYAHHSPDAIISTGFCGALDEQLGIASIVSATAVNGHSARPVTGAIPCRNGIVSSVDHIVQTSAEKAQLRKSGACAVEMEAAGVLERAEAQGIPFACVRAVTDLAGENFANDLNSALRPDGHLDTIRVLTGALRQPVSRVPELLRLRSRAVRAARSLGDFFADCRF